MDGAVLKVAWSFARSRGSSGVLRTKNVEGCFEKPADAGGSAFAIHQRVHESAAKENL